MRPSPFRRWTFFSCQPAGLERFLPMSQHKALIASIVFTLVLAFSAIGIRAAMLDSPSDSSNAKGALPVVVTGGEEGEEGGGAGVGDGERAGGHDRRRRDAAVCSAKRQPLVAQAPDGDCAGRAAAGGEAVSRRECPRSACCAAMRWPRPSGRSRRARPAGGREG